MPCPGRASTVERRFAFLGASMSTQYRLHTQVQSKQGKHHGKHMAAFVAAPILVYVAAYAVWTVLKQQCAAFTSAECLPVGSTHLGGSDVVLLATFLAAGVAAIIEIAADD